MPEIKAGTPQEIAYRLLETIASSEGKELQGVGAALPDRKWLLTTYAECLDVTRGGETAYETGANRISAGRVIEQGANRV